MIKVDGKEINFNYFPNSEIELDHKSLPDLITKSGRLEVTFSFLSNDDLVKLMFIKDYLDELSLSLPIDLIIHYMPYSRMDRSEGGSHNSLKTIAKFINNLGFDRVLVIEPHSDVIPALLDRCRIIEMSLQLLPKVLSEISFDADKDYLVFPDATAQKRYGKFKGFKQILGFKTRVFETGEIGNLELAGKIDTGNERALIVDDLCSGGYTFYLTALKLREMGFKEIYLLVTHTENTVLKGKMIDSRLIDGIYTTDTIFNASHSLITVYSIEEIIKLEEI